MESIRLENEERKKWLIHSVVPRRHVNAIAAIYSAGNMIQQIEKNCGGGCVLIHFVDDNG